MTKYISVNDAIKAGLEAFDTIGTAGDRLSDFNLGQWWVSEIESAVSNGTEDQRRAFAVMVNLLNTIASARAISENPASISTIAAKLPEAVPVGIAGTMPGTSGFTMAAFKADEAPVGTKLYVAPIKCASCSGIAQPALEPTGMIEDEL